MLMLVSAGLEDRWASGVDRLSRVGLPALLVPYYIWHMACYI